MVDTNREIENINREKNKLRLNKVRTSPKQIFFRSTTIENPDEHTMKLKNINK